MKQILILAILTLLASCKGDDNNYKAKLYALDEIEGSYITERIDWEGRIDVDLDNDGVPARELLSEFRHYEWPLVQRCNLQTYADKNKNEYGGAFNFFVYYLEPMGSTPILNIRTLNISLAFHLKNTDSYVFDHFDHLQYRDNWDINQYPARDSFRDGDILSVKNGKIIFRLKEYMVYDYITSSYISAPVLVTFARKYE